MTEEKDIKSILKEGQLYQSQGLLKEARKLYENAIALVERDDSLSEKSQIIEGIEKQIQALDADTYRVENKTHITEISSRDKDLIRRLFSTTMTNDKDDSTMEGAVALAKFGQFDRAISEFEDLIEESPLRIVAAKHILRCHMAIRTLHDPVLQFQKWVSTGYFGEEELAELSTFLERTYGLSVLEQGAAPPPGPPEAVHSPGGTAEPTGSTEEESPPKAPDFDPYEDEYVDVLGGIGGASEKKTETVKEDRPAQEGGAEDFIDILGGGKKKQTLSYDDIADDEGGDYVDYISSVGITLADGTETTLPVNLQTGSVANLIVSGSQKMVLDTLKKGTRLENVKMNSPISVNIGNCKVISVSRIDMGPKKGDYSVDLKIES